MLSSISILFMLGFTINEALKNREQVTNLEATRVRVEALQAFSALSGDIYRLLRLPNSSPIRERAYNSANKEFDLILQYNKQLEGLSAQWDIADSLRDFNQVLIELQHPSPAQRPYLGVLAFDVLQDILVELNDVDIFLADDSIKTEGKIFSDLNNFVFWTQKEAWFGYKLYLYPELREDSLDHYLSTIHRQSQYLNAFIRNSDSSPDSDSSSMCLQVRSIKRVSTLENEYIRGSLIRKRSNIMSLA